MPGRIFAERLCPPEVSREELTLEVARSAILLHGCLLVRGLISNAAAERLVEDIDRTFDAKRTHDLAGPTAETAPWYTPFIGAEDVWNDIDRAAVEAHDGVLAADSPRTLFDFIATYEDAGLRPLLTDYLGERPVLSVKKTTLRRARFDSGTEWWHQDGAFLGQIGALNVWLSLSHCGEDAPSLDIVGRRIDEILPTGIEGADFDWSLGRPVVERVAGNAIVRPIFGPGDALLFDEMLVHKTGASPAMTGTRYAIEAWFFAPSTAPLDRIPLVF
jgi:hypothetical protein